MSDLTEQFKKLNSNLSSTAKNYLNLKTENDRLEEKYKDLKQNWGKESQEVLDTIENELSLAKKQDEDSAFLEFEINCLEEDINNLDKEDIELKTQIDVLKKRLTSLDSILSNEEQINARVEARNKELQEKLDNLGHKHELENLKKNMIQQLDMFGESWNKEFNESLSQMLKTLREKYQVGVQSNEDSRSVKTTVNVS
jgi:chromosome segregation ATPase